MEWTAATLTTASPTAPTMEIAKTSAALVTLATLELCVRP